MENYHVDLLVVFAPALASAVLCVVASMGALRSLFAAKVRDPLLKVLGCREHVNTIISVTTNVMFVGPAVGVLYGSTEDTLLDKRLGVVMGLFCGILLARLSRHAAVLAKNEAEEQALANQVAVREALRAERRARAAAARLARRSRYR